MWLYIKSGVISEDWRTPVSVSFYGAKSKRTECKNYRTISLLYAVRKVYVNALVDRVRRVNTVTEQPVEYEWCYFRSGRGCVDQSLTIKQLSEKGGGRKEGKNAYLGFLNLEKT